MISLDIRSQESELMDDLDCKGEVVDQTLRELDVINRWLGGNHVTIDGVAKLVEEKDKATPITIADLGCGGGEMVRLLAAWSRREQRKLRLVGIDANPTIIRFAEAAGRQDPDIIFKVMNVMSNEYKIEKYDIVVATLFMHHFTTEQLVELFRTMKRQTTVGFVINDIHRHFISYYAIRFLTHMFSRSAMVKYDAPLSVRRAFTRRELEDILRLSGIDNFALSWKWAFRWQLVVNTQTT